MLSKVCKPSRADKQHSTEAVSAPHPVPEPTSCGSACDLFCVVMLSVACMLNGRYGESRFWLPHPKRKRQRIGWCKILPQPTCHMSSIGTMYCVGVSIRHQVASVPHKHSEAAEPSHWRVDPQLSPHSSRLTRGSLIPLRASYGTPSYPPVAPPVQYTCIVVVPHSSTQSSPDHDRRASRRWSSSARHHPHRRVKPISSHSCQNEQNVATLLNPYSYSQRLEKNKISIHPGPRPSRQACDSLRA